MFLLLLRFTKCKQIGGELKQVPFESTLLFKHIDYKKSIVKIIKLGQNRNYGSLNNNHYGLNNLLIRILISFEKGDPNGHS